MARAVIQVVNPVDRARACRRLAGAGGLDAGSSGAPLTGFYEFLYLRLDEQDNLAWPGLVERLAFPAGVHHPRTPADEALLIDFLFDLLDEFLGEIGDGFDLRRLFHEYTIWLTAQDWYRPDLERFGVYPQGDVIAVRRRLLSLGRRVARCST